MNRIGRTFDLKIASEHECISERPSTDGPSLKGIEAARVVIGWAVDRWESLPIRRNHRQEPEIGVIDTPGYAWAVTVVDGDAFVADGEEGPKN